jgi:hypothetical protein
MDTLLALGQAFLALAVPLYAAYAAVSWLARHSRRPGPGRKDGGDRTR